MVRLIFTTLIILCVLSFAIPVESPAIPGPLWDNCTAAMIGLYAAQYNLEVCKSMYAGFNPLSHCLSEIAAVGAAEEAVDMNCTFEQT